MPHQQTMTTVDESRGHISSADGRGLLAGPSIQIYRRLLAYVRPYWRLALVAVVAMVLAAAGNAAFAWIVQPLVDGTFIERDPAARVWVPAMLVGIFLFQGLSMFASNYTVAWVGRNVVADLRFDVFAKYLELPSRFYDRGSLGYLKARLTYNVEQVGKAASKALVVLVRDSLTVVFLVGYMVWLGGWMALIFLALTPLVGLIIVAANRRFRKIAGRMQHAIGGIGQVAEDTLRGHAEVKIAGATGHEKQRFRRINDRHKRQQLRYTAVQSMSQPLVQLIAVIALAIVLFITTSEAVMDTISPGGLLSFITAMALLLRPLKQIVQVNSEIQRAIAAGESLFEVLDLESETDEGQTPVQRARGHIVYEDIRFHYESSPQDVLQDISFELRPGETVALVGRSGSGKTTIASLLPRFYEPAAGRVLLDGQPLEGYRLQDLRRQIALVNQQVVLFNDTVANNIAYGLETTPSQDRLEAAARAANALDFIQALPEGFDTLIGDDGVMLSGGQRQRLAIARALIKDAPILILDEATSALDTESEQMIQDALERLMRSRTTLVIAHRLSTIEDADRIVVLDHGRIVEIGSHAELLSKAGHYAALYRQQFQDC